MSRFDIGWGDVALGLGASVVLCVGGLVVVGIVLVRLPKTYFVGEAPKNHLWGDKHPVVRWTGRILKNLAGLVAVAAGLAAKINAAAGAYTASVNGNTLAFENNIRRHYPAASTTIIKQIHPVRGVGIECLYMERKDATAQQTNNIDFTYAANCWVTGIESNMTNFCHVAVNYSTHILIRGNYFHHAHAYGEGGQGY